MWRDESRAAEAPDDADPSATSAAPGRKEDELARKKIRDAIAELSDPASQRSLDLDPTESAEAFNFQVLAEELRRASQAKRGPNGRAAAKRSPTRAAKSVDSDMGDALGPAAEDDVQVRDAEARIDLDPSSATGLPEVLPDPIEAWSDAHQELHPAQERYRVASRTSVSLAIVNPQRAWPEDVRPDAPTVERVIDASVNDPGEASNADERAFEPDAGKERWRPEWSRLKAGLSTTLGTGTRHVPRRNSAARPIMP